MEDYVVKTSVVGVFLWAVTFIFVRKILFPSHSFEFSSRIVSAIHATLAVILAALSVQDWNCPVCPYASQSSPREMQTLAVTVSYLIYDVVCGYCDKRFNLDNTIHHFVSIVGVGAGLAYQKCGSEMVAALWITEISSPFLHLGEILKDFGYRDTGVNFADYLAFAVTFSLARMVAGPYLTCVTLTANNPIVIKAMALGLQLVSASWFYKIVRMVQYKLHKWTSASKIAVGNGKSD